MYLTSVLEVIVLLSKRVSQSRDPFDLASKTVRLSLVISLYKFELRTEQIFAIG